MKHTLTIRRLFFLSVLLLFSSDKILSQSCSMPVNLHVEGVTSTSAIVDWSTVTGATGYIVKIRESGTSSWRRLTSSNTSEIVTGLLPNKVYEVIARSTCNLTESNYTGSITFTTPAPSCSTPGTSYFTSNNITSNSCTVGWRTVSGASGYVVQWRVRYSSTAWSEGTSQTNSLSLTGLTPGTQYEFKVKTNCSNGATSSFSSVGIFTTTNATCSVPVSLVVDSISQNSVKISWGAIACASSYTLRYRISGDSWSTLTCQTNACILSNLTSGTNYEFGVRSVHPTGGTSSYSATDYFTTQSSFCETPVNIIANTITTNHVTISWDAAASAATYQVRYRLAGALTWQTLTTDINLIDINGLSQDNVYEFQVQCICSPTDNGSFSALSTFMTLPDMTQTVPVPDHIVICIIENKAYSQIVGSSYAPNINALINDPKSAVFTESYGLTHPSQPNYIRLFSGASQGVTGNSMPSQKFNTPNLARELLNAGRTFATYSQGLPSVGYDGESYGNYRRRHNPVTNWMGTGANQVPSTLNLPFSSFPTDYSTLPTVSFVIPDLVNGMHDGSLGTALANGDNWIHNNLTPYIQWAKQNNSLFILTADEDDGDHNNRILTVMCGEMIVDGVYDQGFNHYDLLRTISEMYGLNFIGEAANAELIHGCWTNNFRVRGEETAAATIVKPENKNWSVYPNPAFDELHLGYELTEDAEVTIRLFANTGSLAFEKKLGLVGKGKHVYDVPIKEESFPAGIYFMDVSYGKEKYIQRFIISQRQ